MTLVALLAATLKDRGNYVVATREGDYHVPLTQRVTNKDEFWGFVKALKPQRTLVREDLRVEGSAENRLVSRSLSLFKRCKVAENTLWRTVLLTMQINC